MVCYHKEIEKKEVSPGVLLQDIGRGVNMNVLHWNLVDKNFLPTHQHPEEQFGYVIKGGFELTIGVEKYILSAGDAYFIPPNTIHSFLAIGETEAIDIFSPVRDVITWKK
jgi:quercetin dioxygenase-like cupin family protein